MASREGQGMQIAVILFAILTVVLAITTYIYYAQAEKNDKARIAALEGEKNAKAAQMKANHQLTALKFVLGIIEDRKQIDDAKGLAGGAEDTDVNAWMTQFDNDMALRGAATTESKQNYRDLITYLLGSINKKNQYAVQIQNDLTKETVAKATAIASEQAAAQTAKDGLAAQVLSYDDARKIFGESQLNTTKTANEALASHVAAAAKAKKDLENQKADLDATVANLGKMQNTKDEFAKKVNQLESIQGVNIDNPDAKIIWINQKQRLVWIDRGYDDGLGRQMSFAVYSQSHATLFKQVERVRKEGGGMEKVKKLESKGRIEVVRVTGPHQAECRILEDKASDPILPEDWIHSPAWSPGQRVHFALLGFMDIDGDLESDRETVKHVITMNGGIIDAEIKDDGTRDEGKMSVNTRYVVMGDSGDKGNLLIKNLAQYQRTRLDFLNEMEQFSVEKISVQQLLDMMGWKPEEKTTGLGGVMDAGFRRRNPAGAKPAAPGVGAPPVVPGAASPAEEAPAEEGSKPPAIKPEAADAADPFGGK